MLIPNPASQKKNWQSIYFRFHILRLTSEWYGIEINTYNLPANIFLNENLDGYCSCRHFYLALQKTATHLISRWRSQTLLCILSFGSSRTCGSFTIAELNSVTSVSWQIVLTHWKKSESVQNEAEVPQKHHSSKGCLNLCLFSMDASKNHYSSQNDNFPVPTDRIQTAHLVMVIARSTMWLKFKNGNGMCKSVIFSKSGTACFSCLLPRTLLRPILELDGQLMTLDFRGRSSGFSLRP